MPTAAIEQLQYNGIISIISSFPTLVSNPMSLKKNVLYSSRTADKFVVRLPDGMRDRIAEVARNQHRSMNSEIIARLENSLQNDTGFGQNINLDPNSSDISQHERELLLRFRQLAQRQQSALLTLIASDSRKQI